MFKMPTPGLFVVRYGQPLDMAPPRQGALVEAVRSASSARTVAIVFVIGDDIRSVDFAVPSFWMRVVADPTMKIGAMAMVTGSLAVEIAARSFGAASRFRRQPIEVRTFADEPAAVSWATRFLTTPPAPGPGPAPSSGASRDVLTRGR